MTAHPCPGRFRPLATCKDLMELFVTTVEVRSDCGLDEIRRLQSVEND